MKFLKELEAHLRGEFAAYPADDVLSLDECPAGQQGDFTLNCFRIGKFCGNPMTAAQKVAEFLQSHPDIEGVTVIKAFVNISVKAAVLHGESAADTDALLARGILPENKRKRVLI